MPSDEDYKAMAASRQEVRAICQVCNKEFYTKAAADDHIETEEHLKNVRKRGMIYFKVGEKMAKKETKSYPCTYCGWAMGERPEKDEEPQCNHCKKR